MTDKQIIIDIKNSINKVKNIEKMYFALLDKYKAKEQECEELKKQHQADKGLITSTGKMNYQLLQEYDKLKTALTEIKEIAEKHAPRCNKNLNCNYECEACHLSDLKQILQKISEVEDE